MPTQPQGAYKLRALKFSVIAIASVVIVEVLAGLIINSLAVLSDGLHALLDGLSGVMLFVATRASLKPPDEEHLYGHEKFESIGGLIGGIVLIGVALLIFYEAAVRLMGNVYVNEELQLAGYLAIGYALCIDLFRLGIFRKARRDESTAVKAGFYDAISDLSSTIIALLGFGLATFGFYYGDSLASIFLGGMLIYLSVKLARTSIMELSDTASKEMVQRIQNEIASTGGVLKCENLKVRKTGAKTFIETTVQVPNHLSLDEAHALASKVEANLEGAFGFVEATIHIEPSEKETEMEQLVGKLATVDGVREVHEISTVYASGKLYITLHAYVDPELSVEEAHEIAEEIEGNMRAGIKHLENATVHVEPFGVKVRATEVNENELRNIIHNVAQSVKSTLRINRIVTYAAGEKRYINLDCCFTKQVTITEAHETATQIEEEIKERFADAIVTVHIEPDCTS